MGFFRSFKSLVSRPFHNLSIQQRILQFFRLGTSLLTIAFGIAYLIASSDIESAYLARINCAHLDVALGLYKSLRSSISSTGTLNQDLLPVDNELTDSEIHILTQYTEKQVADAAQYILLGANEFCMISFDYVTHVKGNITEDCQSYNGIGIFDYRAIMLEAGLDIILAYAYESSYKKDDEYSRRLEARNKRFGVLKPVMIFQILAQAAIIVYGLVLYSNRGGAKDLSSIPNITMNGLALLAVAAGIIMIVASSIAINELRSMKKEIAKGMSSYGVKMILGDVFQALLWCTFAFSVFTMLLWALPLWCSNPADDGYNSDDEITYHYRDDPDDNDRTYVVKPYQVSRQLKRNKTKKSISRLFDDAANFENDNDHPPRSTSVESTSYHDNGPFASPEDYEVREQTFEPERAELSSHVHTETELRKLGATITRKFSGRRKDSSKSKRTPHRNWLPEKSTTHDLLYGENHFSNHQYPQTLPGVAEGGSLSRASTLNKLNTPNRSRSNTGGGLQSQPHQNMLIPDANNSYERSVDNISVLDEQEMQLLDNNQFINKIV
ncbi:hypothetical protein C7M61_000090 [Candidozyma pseudohaemuli]|uniref:Uncharacterized protein n=1 Tax=Candidozyma pseudohaemuli TaxID=418784 RepID=A0A2P7YWX0_9ASCO|nr:hypothetical protein C7M61_000090 [[Candida] pseudohaemulonii]PSK40450.1 hypothetical protein C7M61_000090 [[Candida] pseudohaemulonii]